MGLTESFIAALQAGQQYAHTKKRQKWEEEDRSIEKDLLQHRLKEIKINERIQARNAAIGNLSALQGLPEDQFAQKPLETSAPDFSGGIPTKVTGGGGPDVPTVDIPGVDELGVPGISVRPQTMEEVLAKQLAELKQKALWTPRTAARGGIVAIPGMASPDNPQGVVAQGDKVPETLHPYTTRDANGVEKTEYLTSEELAKRPPAVKFRLPSRGNGSGITRATPEEIATAIEGVVSGDTPASKVPNMTSDLGVRINSGIKKRGFNLTKALEDEKAFSRYLSTLNSDAQQRILSSAGAVKDSLDVLEKVVDAQGDKTVLPGTKEYNDLQQAVKPVIDNLAILKSGGSASNDKALEAALNEIGTGWIGGGMKAKIARLRNSLSYRVGAIKGAFISSDDVTKKPEGTSTSAVKNAADVAAALKAQGRPSDDATVKKVLANPAAMKALFGGQ